MSTRLCLTALAALPLMASIGWTPVSDAVVAPAQAADGARCEIRASKRGSGTAIEGFVVASQPLSGSYRISVAAVGSGGTSDIDQSGAFSATAGQPVSLGVVQLGAGGYQANLTVKWAGGATSCAGRG